MKGHSPDNGLGTELMRPTNSHHNVSSALVQKRARAFLRAHDLAVIATVDETGSPHAATVRYASDENFNVYFMTRIESRKFRNVMVHAKVAVVITDTQVMETVQMTGIAGRIEDMHEESAMLSKLWKSGYTAGRASPIVKMYEAGHTRELAVIRIAPLEMTHAVFDRGYGEAPEPFFYKVI